jgi:NTP pyrophosphatase (non-canonical NTP hydrolase)
MELNELQKKIYDINSANGWHEKDPQFESPEEFFRFICNCHSEISESFEEYKNNRGEHYYTDGKPQGLAVELADVIIYILDYAAGRGFDMDKIINEKIEYNATRGYRHGNKKA